MDSGDAIEGTVRGTYPTFGYASQWAAVLDANEDNHADLYVANAGGGQWRTANQLLLGDGDGGFAAVVVGDAVIAASNTAGVVLERDSFHVIVFDANEDNNDDLFVTQQCLGGLPSSLHAKTAAAGCDCCFR